ncbi:SDR family NAD(P)-dependent oxidoreductase [Mycobacterium shimoidei]|uniref:Short-chain dehydrogenase/reductase SDR [Sphingomonas wittichii RW1] n=1 Tax=Mycobacterium shimoidei TaxID=29313 RepID=A0A1E3TKG7_MYCSH|nr:SDR family oxidoreductase [Mycobacterium shimoidei]MCV7260016.1 SDR family oxidoreductase [Mycobacterium shimoidei]ODR14953.1 short-chain dehydrogenase [Mycobacterium shimoidei]ORW79121.1 short-chain dehydrogenase [Mycobacterium shimoidei]SRX94419.1 short-chain dehydrogenase/reductase SDR [Sphingomonas wittichii RW1] [Mycobacterium shimoidei]
MNLDDFTVLVTGAGGGVGRGIALAVAAHRAHVLVATRSETGQAVVEEITARGQSAAWVRCDVALSNSVADAVAEAIQTTGRLDAVVHNATSNSSSQPHQLAQIDDQLWNDHYSVSVGGAYHCASAAFESLSARGGSLVVMTSPAGIEGSATLPLYATMKGALRGFAKSLAREWAPHGITVNVVSPLAYSPALTAAIEAEPAMEERLSRRIPLGRIGDPEQDIGSAVAFLIGPRGRYITGQTLGVDGGHFTNL